MPDTIPDSELLKRTAIQLERIDPHALDATLPAPPPPAERLVSIDHLPLLDVRPDDADAAFALGSVLGQGGMGVVQQATQRALAREVAVKRLRSDLENVDQAALLLLDEALITGALDHPNVVPVYALGRDDAGRPVMVMKRLAGISWRELLHDPEHPFVTARQSDALVYHLEILMQVCNALHFAHSRDVIHRDIKPENVVVGEYSEVYLLDWGAAFQRGRGLASQAIVGTLAYMAPEMLEGTGDHISSRTDVYLLGATLHELLTGSPPHVAADIDSAVLSIHRSIEPQFADTVPAELAELCRRALRRNPDDRPSSALAFKAAIGDYLSHRDSYELAAAATVRLRNLLQLCRSERLADLDAAVVNRLHIECTFGYRQALERWSHNREARAGLQEATEAMVEFELGRRNLEGAAAHLEQLLEGREDLRARVDALRDALSREEREVAQLRDDARERDPTEGSGARAIQAVVTGVVLAALFLWLSRAYPRAVGLTHRTVALVTLSLGVALAGGAIALKDKLLSTRINRYLSGAMFAIVTGCLLVHVAGGLMDASVTMGLIADLLIAGTVVATVGVNLHPGLVAVGAVYLLGAIAAAAAPDHILEMVAGVFLISHLVVAWTWNAVMRASARAM